MASSLGLHARTAVSCLKASCTTKDGAAQQASAALSVKATHLEGQVSTEEHVGQRCRRCSAHACLAEGVSGTLASCWLNGQDQTQPGRTCSAVDVHLALLSDLVCHDLHSLRELYSDVKGIKVPDPEPAGHSQVWTRLSALTH